MKIFKITFFITAFLCLTFSCSESDKNSSGPDLDLAQQQNETENRIIPISELQSGITIVGATSKTWTPPQPNGSLDFQINTDKQEGFQEAGLDIKFSTLDDIQGAYVLFQDSNGNKLDSYLDVPLSALEGKTVIKKNKKSLKQNKVLTGDEYLIDVDFDNISPGTFCYEICLYDENNNISVVENICIEVEAWGGNSEIVGEWVFDRSSDDEDNTETIDCENGETITVNYYRNEEDWVLVLNTDGSYYETYKGFDEFLDIDATEASCSAVYTKGDDSDDKYSGNWAYNEDKNTLTIIDFSYENLLDTSENESFPKGSVYFDGNNTKASVISGELVITDNYSEDNESFSDSYTFKRK